MSEYAALVRFGVAGLVLIVAYVFVDRHGYNRGVQAKVAFYEPLLRQAADDKIAADLRATTAEQRATQITSQVEQSHAEMQQSLTARAVAAEQRIDTLLRERADAVAHRSVPMPTLPGSAPERPSSAPSDERDQRFAASVSAVGRQCEHDASELAEWQAWYDRQRSSLTEVVQETH